VALLDGSPKFNSKKRSRQGRLGPRPLRIGHLGSADTI
jgi:hypothetical protein